MTTITQAKKILEALGKLQVQGQCKGSPCPRCGNYLMSENVLHNALSRYATVYVCDLCGMDEALMDASFKEPLALNKWAMIKGLEAIAENEGKNSKEGDGNRPKSNNSINQEDQGNDTISNI